jgi:hypothetical protein
MLRRDISKALLATAAGSTVVAQRTEAQSCTAPCYAQTAAEIAAMVTPVNYAYAPGNVLRYGTNTTPGTTDMTAALKAAVNQSNQVSPNPPHSPIGTAVYIPSGIYNISSTITLYAGTKITGDGWAAQSGIYNPVAGTILNYTGAASTVFLSLHGASPGNYAETLTLRDLAIYNSGGQINCTGIQLYDAPFSILENLYIAGFIGTGQPGTSNGIGVEQEQNSWGCTFRNVKILNCTTCLSAHDAGEDSTYVSCSFRSYNYANGIGIYQGNQCQTNIYIGCDISENLYGVLMNQGDTGGNGTGNPYPMHGTFLNCQFEDSCNAAIAIVTSNQSASTISSYPSVEVINCRAYNNGIFFPANNGQAVIYAQVCSQIKVMGLTESGYSYGAILGCSSFGYTFSGTSKPGPVTFEMDEGYVYGTSRFASPAVVTGAYIGSTAVLPGDHSLVRLTSSDLSYVNSNFTRVPFGAAISDPLLWYQSSVLGIQPSKKQTIRFKAQVVTQSAGAVNYSLFLYKNGAPLLMIASTTVNTAGQPLVLSGEGFDVPSGPGYGAGDYYWIVVFAGANFTLDTANSYFIAELLGL